MNASPRTPLWHRLVPGLILAYLGYCVYNWISSLVVHASGRTPYEIVMTTYSSLHEAAIHTSDNVSLGHLAIFALLLIAVRALYSLLLDPEQQRRDKERASRCVTRGIQRVRSAYELLAMPAPYDNKVDAAHADQLLVTHVRSRIGGI